MLQKLKITALPLSHLLVGCIVACFALSVYTGWTFVTRMQTLKFWKEKIAEAESKLPLLKALPMQERDLLNALKNADPLYLEHQLGALRLSRLETYSLETGKERLSDKETMRLHFLMGEENALHFLPGKIVKGPAVQAVEMKQEHVVEADERDVQRILAHIEGISIGSYAPSELRPPMAIKKFILKRKKLTQQRFPSYLLEIELWRREPVQNP